jgi:hypothetical protein
MAYVAPVFLEHSMSEAQKLTALNTLETQCDEGADYIDAYMHDSDYYTETEMDATFYKTPDHPDGRSDTGHGCGVDAATVDGFTLAAIRQQALPPGCITFWCLSEASIPTAHGWRLWDDGKGKFILAAGGSHSEEDEGGAVSVIPTCEFTSTGTALSGTQIANHVHSFDDQMGAYLDSRYQSGSTVAKTANLPVRTTLTVDEIENTTSTQHTHPSEFFWGGYYDENNTLHDGNSLGLYPHYKALCWVIKE